MKRWLHAQPSSSRSTSCTIKLTALVDQSYKGNSQPADSVWETIQNNTHDGPMEIARMPQAQNTYQDQNRIDMRGCIGKYCHVQSKMQYQAVVLLLPEKPVHQGRMIV